MVSESSATARGSGAKVRKRSVICADGTWNDPEDENPTNVVLTARAIRPEDDRQRDRRDAPVPPEQREPADRRRGGTSMPPVVGTWPARGEDRMSALPR